MTILDCHVHTWLYPDHYPGDVFLKFIGGRPPGLSEAQFKEASTRRAPRILKEMKEAGVDKALVVGLKSGTTLGMDVPNEFVAKEVKSYPDKLSWACAVNFLDPNAPAEVERCVKDLGAVALGEIGPGYGFFRIDDERCFPVYEVVRSLDVPMCIHAGPTIPSNTMLKYTDLEALDSVCANFPELKIVLCHFGEPHCEEAAHLMAKHTNLYADISMLPFAAGISTIFPTTVSYPYFALDHPLLFYFSVPARNRDKLIFGSDVQHPKEAIEGFQGVNPRLEKMGLPKIPQDAFDRIFHENWKQVFTKIKA
ncbi:MAG: amidohydrolase family protein [Chloroflexi bacterium]|nr:amidohydrolase family protein [Chloroflexota bacterium]